MSQIMLRGVLLGIGIRTGQLWVFLASLECKVNALNRCVKYQLQEDAK